MVIKFRITSAMWWLAFCLLCVVLKLTGVAGATWWIILLPFYVPLAAGFLAIVGIMLFILIMQI